jgi:hypothetical protein
LWQTLVAQKDFLGVEKLFGEKSKVPENGTGNFTLRLHRLQPFNFTKSQDGKTISFRSPELPSGYGEKASILFIDAKGAVSQQENVLPYSDKVLPDFCLDAIGPSPDGCVLFGGCAVPWKGHVGHSK